jgi:hypothetical protein
MSEIKYPATRIVHWPNGPVPCCDAHAAQLAGLAGFLGAHVAQTVALHDEQCANCVNEANVKEPT